MSSNKSGYAVILNGGPLGASFSVYLNDYPENGQIVGGKIISGRQKISIPLDKRGEGKIKMYSQQRNRTFQGLAYSVKINLSPDKKNIIDLSPPRVRMPSLAKTPKRLIKSKLQEKVQARKQSLSSSQKTTESKSTKKVLIKGRTRKTSGIIKSKLQEKVQARKQSLDTTISENDNQNSGDSTPSKKTGGEKNFWDKFNKK